MSSPSAEITSASSDEVTIAISHRWSSVLGAHLLYISSWGLLSAYGVYAQYYTDDLLREHPASAIAWPGTTQAVLLIAVGVFTGPLFDRGWLTTLVMLGTAMITLGMMMLSLSTTYYEVLLSQGVCVGLGSGVMYVPSLTLVTVTFQRRRSLAVALTTCGSSIGGIVYPIAFQELLPRIGFEWATRVLGFITLSCSLAGSSILIVNRGLWRPKPMRTLLDIAALRNGAYLSFNMALLMVFMSFFIPLFYLPEYAISLVGYSTKGGIYALVGLNASFLPSRLGAAYAAELIGPPQVFLTSVSLSAVCLFCWIVVGTKAGLVVWIIVFGLVAGPITVMPAVTLPLVCPDPDYMGTHLGMAWMFAAVGGLVGAPVAGALITNRTRDFLHAQVFAGTIMSIGGLLLIPTVVLYIRQMRVRKQVGGVPAC